MRLPAEQTSPWLKKTPNSAPSTAASKSASAKKMFGDLPPSSSEIFFSVSAAARMIVLPTSALPVNAILSTSACSTIAAPVSPSPVTMLTTPGRQAGVGEAGRQLEDRQRRLLGRLQHRRAAGADRRRELPRRHQQRVVPRDDLAGDADRLAQREAHRVVGHRDDVAVNLGGQAAVVLEAGGDVGDVELRFDDRLAGVARLELGELVGALADDVGRSRTGPGRGPAPSRPSRPVVERRARGLHRAIDVGGAGVGHAARSTSVVDGSMTSTVADACGATNSPLM